MTTSATDATRYLCSSAHLDSSFREKVIRFIVEEEHRAICPSPGVDVVWVVNHCLAARHRKLIRDIFVGVFYLLAVVLSIAIGDITPFLVFWGLAWIVIFMEMWDSHSLVANNLLKSNFNPDCVPNRLSEDQKKGLEVLQADSNVSIYSGFSPFVGSGIDLGGWSFSLDTHKGKEEFGKILEPAQFEVEELYDHVVKNLEELGIQGLSVDDRLFVHGKDIRGDKRFLSDVLARPTSRVDPELVKSFVGNPTHVIRHYKCIRVADWNGELVVSIFLRFSKQGASLFAETSYFLLMPISETYRRSDNFYEVSNASQFMACAALSTSTSVFVWMFGWLLLFNRIIQRLSKSRDRRLTKKLVKYLPTFDYGATASMRESVSSWEYRRYFQKLDKELYVKTIERQLLEGIIEFCSLKGIDTSDLRERQTTILNSGVIVTGGEVKAHSLAIGQRSKALGTQFIDAVATAAGGR